MSKKLYHFLNGNLTSSFDTLVLTGSNTQIIPSGSRWYNGTGSAFQIGSPDGSNNRAALYSNFSTNGGFYQNHGTGDLTVTFWWKPNAGSFINTKGNVRFLYRDLPIQIANYPVAGKTSGSFDLRAYFSYDNDQGNSVAKSFLVDVTGDPWIRFYASRINGVFQFVLQDEDGNVIQDTSNNAASWSYNNFAHLPYNASSSNPGLKIGGNFSEERTVHGTYDDIMIMSRHGVAYADLETDGTNGNNIVNPVVNSFSTSAASVSNSGDSVNLSWDVDFGTTLQLLKYVGGILNSTEAVTGTSSKSVTITQTVSYKLRATNIYGSSDSSSVEITLNGGNTVAKLSGSSAIPYQLHGGFLGGFVTDGENAFQHLPIMSGSDGSTDMDYLLGRSLNAGFAGVSGSIISALNHLYTEGDFQAGTGVSSAQLGMDIIGVSASHLSFEFEGGSGKLELASNVAGTGLSLASGQLSVDAAQTQITSVGTIAAGVWNATDIGVAHGGTGASSAGDARTNLGVAIGSDVLAYDAEVQKLAGMLAADELAVITPTEMAVLDGVTATTAELNYLDNDDLASSDFVKLAAVTSDATELNLLDGSSAGSKVASKAVIYDALKGVQGDYVSGSVAVSGALGAFGSLTFGGVALTSTATELNLLDGVSGLVKADFTKLAAVDSSANQLNLLNNADLVAGDITKLAALDVSAAELNLLDAVAGSSVALADGDGFIMFDADDSNNAKKVVMTDFLTYIAANDDERVQDIVGAMVSSNTESGISVTYADEGAGAGSLDFSVDVAAANISSNAVGADAIVTNGVGSLEIVADAVNSAKILDGSVTSAQMAEIIDHSAASHAVVLDANAPDSITGLFLKGKNAAGDAATFQVKIDGGLLQLVSVSTPSASGETSANAAGTNGS